MPNYPRIGFIHIPKTAGSSFVSVLRELYPLVHETTIFDFGIFADLLIKMPVIVGHVPLSMYLNERPRRQLCTILRDPVKRVISYYKYVRATPTHYLHDYICQDNLSISECYQHPALKLDMTNFQTKMLGWESTYTGKIPATDPHEHKHFMQMVSEYLFAQADKRMLDRAMENLQNNVSYGIIEDSESIASLIRMISGNVCTQLPTVNATPKVDCEIHTVDLRAIVENNNWDLLLYQEAKNFTGTVDNRVA